MKTTRRLALLTVLSALAAVGLAPAAQASFGIAKWEAGSCEGTKATVRNCEYTSPPRPSTRAPRDTRPGASPVSNSITPRASCPCRKAHP